MSAEPINNPRAEIDAIDEELLRLLNRRAEIALRVGAVKRTAAASLCDPGRENDVLVGLRSKNQGPLDDHGVENIFQRVIDECLLLQQRAYAILSDDSALDPVDLPIGEGTRVAFLGEPGTFSEEALIGLAGEQAKSVSMPTFDDLFAAIDRGRADLILAPLENSLIGSVHRCVDLMLESSLSIVAEAVLPVAHFLVAGPDASLETIRTVESHPAALAQCRRFFAAYPQIKVTPADDTAGSVRRAVESGDPTRAAIGSLRAAQLYGGQILREHVEDNSDNYTRFVLLAKDPVGGADGAKVSMVIRLESRPGALHNALRPFVRRNIDLTKIESLPIRQSPGEFNFYLDASVPVIEGDLTGALDEIGNEALSVRVLGRYSTKYLGGSESAGEV